MTEAAAAVAARWHAGATWVCEVPVPVMVTPGRMTSCNSIRSSRPSSVWMSTQQPVRASASEMAWVILRSQPHRWNLIGRQVWGWLDQPLLPPPTLVTAAPTRPDDGPQQLMPPLTSRAACS